MKNRKNKNIIIAIILVLITLSIVGGVFLYNYLKEKTNGNKKYLSIHLLGQKEITLNYKEKYKDNGAKAFYKDENLTSDIQVTNNVDYKKLGTYEYKYKIKYKNQTKELTRKVSIIDKEVPKIALNGDKEMILHLGDTYKDPGAKAIDNYDGDITKNIKIDNKSLNNKKEGTYKITYTITDSSNNTSKIERTIKVIKKEELKKKNITTNNNIQKVPVLNYHFFYKSKSEKCNEDICLDVSNFRKQLDYLKENGYKALTMDEFVDWMYGKITIPKKSVLITIDDGAHGTSKINGNHLIPILEEYKMHATLFLITGWWDIKDYYSPYLDIESHTHNLHFAGNCGYRSKVNCVSYKDLLEDLKKSLKVVKSSKAFCFPFYSYSDKSIKAVKEAGFKTAFIGGYRKATQKDNKYKIPRYPVHDSTSMKEFKNMIN